MVGLFVLRRRELAGEAGCRTPGYPPTPALYLLGASVFIVYVFIGGPLRGEAGRRWLRRAS